MKKTHIIYAIAILIFISGLPLLLYFFGNRDTLFYDYKNEFSGIVLKSTYGSMGSRVITFKNGFCFDVDPYYKSDTIKGEQLKMKEWNRNLLSMFLMYGDSIFKTQGSDTVFVYRKGECYTFINRYEGEKK